MNYVYDALCAMMIAWYVIGTASVYRLMYLELKGRISFKSPRHH